MIRRELADLVFSAAGMARWNDHARPSQFTELAKQAHKMTIAWTLGMAEEENGAPVQWNNLIEGGLFEFFHRVTLTDIKPAVFHRMMETHGRQLNVWALEKTRPCLEPLEGGFYERFRNWLMEQDSCAKERRILRAAHFLATRWEFSFIYEMNRSLWGVEETRKEIETRVEEHLDLAGVHDMLLRQNLEQGGRYAFVDLCGQLRFQERWAQTPRAPRTSVLGHLFTVAALSWFVSLESGLGRGPRSSTFFAALFHDLPEVLTRDIVSPVKRSVEGLEDIVKEYEAQAMEQRLLPLLPEPEADAIRFYTGCEFDNRARDKNGKTRFNIPPAEFQALLNADEGEVVDGRIVEACDKFAAFMEASLSLEYGIRTPSLEEGRNGIYERYKDHKVGPFDFGELFRRIYKADGR